MEKLSFGTDGVRGIYGQTITDETAFGLGYALGKMGGVLIGEDNRPSSPALRRALAAGVKAGGGNAVFAGLTTTPALFFSLKQRPEAYAVMVTASHNPPEHNGLKVFSKEGKLSASARRLMESKAENAEISSLSGEIDEDRKILSGYKDFILSFAGDLSGISAAVDLGGGAGYAFRDLLEKTGAKVRVMNARANGDKINVGCGALFPETLAREVVENGLDMGFCLDGDGDRIVAVNEKGEILDGDKIVYLLACRMKEAGILKKNEVALTVMTNSGVLESLGERGIGAVTCAVGDSAVAETMKAEGLNLGGEQSGHVILGDILMTGDALLAGIALMKLAAARGGKLPDVSGIKVYPQVLRNVCVKDKTSALSDKVRDIAERIKGGFQKGRILVRASGTENLIRVMAEHPSRERAERAAEEIAAAIRQADSSSESS